ncbi:MAG TPA: GntR family transcriptional regulator [Candidatus Limnocylindrales bacterium]|nr:GntR family transcriptional regulator [Candidatus Limnocylindrales bacterium]
MIPYYFQLKEHLKLMIEDNKLLEGEQIPSELDLCQSFGVSRTVVRQAINELVNEGLLTRRKGKGTFVARPKIIGNLLQNLSGLHREMTGKDLSIVNKVLGFSVVKAGKKISEKLQLAAGEKIFQLVRLRFINDEPIVYVTSYIPYALCPGLSNEDFSRQSLYATLEEKYGLEIDMSRRSIEAIAATDDVAALLDIDPNAPLLFLKSISYLKNGHPVEYFEAKHRGDRSGFEVELVRAQGKTLADTLKVKKMDI